MERVRPARSPAATALDGTVLTHYRHDFFYGFVAFTRIALLLPFIT